MRSTTSVPSSKLLAPLSGTPVYKIGELHTIFYLCFLVLLVYLSVFAFVSYIKNTKKIVLCLLVVVSMSLFTVYGVPPEVEFRNFKQESGENLKKACDRLF